MRTRTRMVVVGACAVLGIGAAGCGGSDNKEKSETASAKSGPTLKLSSAATKLTSVSADVHGITGTSKGKLKSGGANSLQPGETLDISGLPQNIIDTVKQKAGLDVKVQCPPSVVYSPGAVFYCKLYTADGTGYDVKC